MLKEGVMEKAVQVEKLVRMCLEMLDSESTEGDLIVAKRCLEDSLDFINSYKEENV